MAAINRTETNAAIDRAMDALKAMKNQLKAKKLNGSSLNSLLGVVDDELRAIKEPISNQYNAYMDELILENRRLFGPDL